MLTQISSADNAKVKLVRKLASRKGRNEEGRFVAEGLNLVSEMIAREIDIDFIMAADDFDPGSDERALAVRDYMEAQDSTACTVSRSIFDKLTDAEHGIDMLAVVQTDKKGTEYIETLPSEACILVCDRVQDPGNIGTMIRTAVAAGYGAVMLLPGTVDVYSPKVLRATAGMVFEIPIIHAADEADFIDAAKSRGLRIAVSVPSGGAAYYDEDLSEGIALVVGNEGAGISESIIDKADVRVTLPMKDGIESLNAAIAAAILMYEAIRSK